MKGPRVSQIAIVLLHLNAGVLYSQSSAQSPASDPSGSVILNPAAGEKLAFTQQPTNTQAGATISPPVTVQLKDKSDRNISQAGVSVTLTLSSGTGALSGTTTRTTDAQGLATFAGLNVNLIGSKQLKASATGFSSATSNTFTITLGPAARLRIQTEPSGTATAGVPFLQQPVVWVEDAGGNRVTTDNSTVVTAARLEGEGVLQGILTATARGGIVTFSNLSHNTANTISLRFTSGMLTPDTSRSIVVNPAAAARLVYMQQPSVTTAGALIAPAVTVALNDAYGNRVATTGTPVTVALASGTGLLGGTLTKNSSSGVATFSNLSINLSGPKTLRATSGSLTAAISNEFSIQPGPGKALIFVQQPTNTAAGSPLSPPVTVQVRDSLGNDVTAAGVTVSISILSGTGVLSGTTTRPTSVAGLATFNDLSINLAGSKTLSATAPGLLSAVSAVFTIAAGPAARLAFVQQPTMTRAGAFIAPAITVQVKDALGNSVRAAGISTSIALTSGTGNLTGTLPQLTDASGIATFSNLTINLSGTKQLTASGTGLVSAVSDTFSITAAAAGKLVFTTSPSGGTAGIPFGVQPAVTLQDAFGNIVRGVPQTVTLAIQNNPGPGGVLMGTKSIPVNTVTGRADFTTIAIDRVGSGYTLTATGSTVSTVPGDVVSTPFTVTAGPAGKVRVENAPDGSGLIIGSQNVTSGTSIVVFAIARDAYDNFVANIPADAWTLTSITGSVAPTDLASGPDRKNARFTARLAGTGVITAAVGGLTSVPSGTLTVVVAGSPTQIRVETSANGTGTVLTDRSISSGSTLTVYAIGRDAAGNFVSNLAADSWSLQSKTGGVADGDLVGSPDRKAATFTARLLGGARIRATSGTLAATSSGVLAVVAGAATTITAIAGTPQSTRAGTAFPARLSARVQDAAGNPVRGIQVVWTAPVSGATGDFAPGGSVATTDSNGVAVSGVFTANTVTGAYTVLASFPGGPAGAVYSLANTFGVAARLRPVAGASPQQAAVTAQFSSPLAAILLDSLGNVVSGVPVTFVAPVSGPSGTFTGAGRTATIPTGPGGIATPPAFTANSTAGLYQVVATAAGIADSALFELTNMAGAASILRPAAGTPQSTPVGSAFSARLRATVEDASGNPLPGVPVIFSAPLAGASARFSGGPVDTAMTLSDGTATASSLVANSFAGIFTILARTPAVSTPAAFVLTNEPGPVDTLLVEAGGGGRIGTQIAQIPFTVRVTANDRFGNIATHFNGTADISSNGVISPEGRLTMPFISGVLDSHSVAMQQAGQFLLRAIRTGGAESGRTDTFEVHNPVPSIKTLAPATGGRGQSLVVTITGTGFLPGATTVSFGDRISTSTTVISPTELSVEIGVDTAAALGKRDVFVFNGPPGGGIGTLAGGFEIGNNPLPILVSVSPDSGAVLQRMTLVFTGNNFVSGISGVNMGAGILVNAIAVDSPSELRADVSISSAAPGGMRRLFVSNIPPGGGTSDSVPFHITRPLTPYPVLKSPADSVSGTDTVVTFRWHPWLHTGIEYRLQVSTSPAFSTTIFDDSTIADTSMEVTSLLRGVTYYWRVFARSAGGSSEPSPTRSFTASFAYPENFYLYHTVPFPLYGSGAGYSPSEFRLVGLPGTGDMPVSSLLSGAREADWVAYWDNGAPREYLVPFNGTATFRFSRGRAFWVLHRGPVHISTSVPTLPLDSVHSVWIPLHPGWNLITNPFLSAVQWSSVQNANAPGTVADLWGYQGGFARSPTFAPFEGYMFDNADRRESLRIPYAPGAARKVSSDELAVWRLDIELSAGNVTDRATSIGVSAAARRGRDPLDLRMPRGVGEMPHVFFSRPGWDSGGSFFATDIRPAIDSLETWPLKVRAVVQNPAQLSFSGVSDVPLHYQVVLIDDERGRAVNLRVDSMYGFVPAVPVSQFRIIVGTEAAVGEVLGDLTPEAFALGSNFPNPFNSTTTIPLLLPRNSMVTLKVYTILGEEVKTLYTGPLEPGRQWITWEGTDARGRSVSSGVYLVRLTTDGGQALIGKMLLVR